MIIKTQNILDWLIAQKFEAQIQPGTQQILSHLEVSKQQFPFFLKIEEESSVVQFLVFVPYALPKGMAGDIGRLLHFFNREVDFPGFGMDEDAGAVFYRCVGLGIDGEINDQILEKIFKTLPRICEAFFPMIATVMLGKLKVDTLLEKAKAARQKLAQEGKK